MIQILLFKKRLHYSMFQRQRHHPRMETTINNRQNTRANNRPFLCRHHNYVTALAGGKTKGKLEAANSNLHRLQTSYIRSLKYHLVVMLGARIDIVQAPIWDLIAYQQPLSEKKRRQLWLNAIKRADWTETIVKNARVCSAHFLSEKVK